MKGRPLMKCCCGSMGFLGLGAVLLTVLSRARATDEVAQDNLARWSGVVSSGLSDVARESLRPGGEPVVGGALSKFWIEPKTLHNILRSTSYSAKICKNYLFPPLLDLDPNTFELIPELAEARAEVSEDHLRYGFRIRPGVYWHRGLPDGTKVEVTTRDVQFSWDMMHHPDLVCPGVAWLDRFQRLKVIDDYRFEVELDEPYFRAEFDFGFEFRLMPAHLCDRDPVSFEKTPLGRAPVGYGPYRFERWEEGRQLVLQRHPDYFDHVRRPFPISTLRFVFLKDTSQLVDLFRRGDLDLVAVQEAQQFEDAKKDPVLQVKATFHEYFVPQWIFIAWNNDHWAFQDRRVRLAMTHLYPRELVRDRFYQGHAALVTGPYSITAQEYDHDIPPWPFDPERARELLREAGFGDTNRNGILDRDGKDFEYELLFVKTRVPALEQGLLLFQQELKKVGIVVHLRTMEFQVILDRVRDGKFDAAQLGWGPDPRDDDLTPVLHSSHAGGGYNYPNYRSEACDALLDQFRNEFDPEKRLAIGRRIHRQVHEDQPCTYLFNPQSIVLISTRFRNVNITRSGAHHTDWWVAPRE